MRSSMAWPCSSRCSISMSSFTPSTTICTSSTSEKPRRSALDTSKTPPTAAVSTPPAETARPSGWWEMGLAWGVQKEPWAAPRSAVGAGRVQVSAYRVRGWHPRGKPWAPRPPRTDGTRRPA
uniref:Uncharacterized protein n=1 Tax=Prolemur simus TaxID=1328070 RepID=A0A8C8ZDW5_PROSS